ncbi:hypothetical protein [Paenibacillus sp. AN1007]|uniref:Chloramphenicol phosphotransferase n=1 Tax=Paenibacillus sp. AN1007 TaxID=3151385 RepID=A0AAU8N5U1_9BACL
MKRGLIIFLNGVSSSGKTSIAEEMKQPLNCFRRWV